MEQFLKGWKVASIEILPEKRGAEITFQIDGHDPVRFRTRKFGIGRRGAKSAALAKFAAQAGYGTVEDVFRYVSGLPSDMVGGIFQTGPLGLEAQAPPALHLARRSGRLRRVQLLFTHREKQHENRNTWW